MTKRLVQAVLVASIVLALGALWNFERPFFSSAEGAISVDTGEPQGGTPTSGGIRGQGRLVTRPGARVTLGAEVSGMVISLPVSENQIVKKGALLLEVDSRQSRARLAQARARIAGARRISIICLISLIGFKSCLAPARPLATYSSGVSATSPRRWLGAMRRRPTPMLTRLWSRKLA